jgi:DHA2 family multidrug resistance protein-like MFS transporter
MTLVLVVLDGAIANVALPSIAGSFHAAASDTVWVVSSYQLAVLLALLPCGALGEILGPRRVFLSGVALFVVASAACAFAVSLPMLVVARFAQGLGGGAIMALATMNLRFAVPHRMVGAIIGVNAMTIAVVLLCGFVLPKPEGKSRRLDALAVFLNSAMFVLFFFGADHVAKAPALGAGLMTAAAACFAGLLWRERQAAAPLVPVDLFADPAFRVAVAASICGFAGQMMSYVALPFYLQHSLHMTPTQAGLYMMPWPAAVIVVAPVAGWLSDRMSTAWLCALGGGLLAGGLAVVGLCPPNGGVFIAGTVMAGIGFGFFQTPNNRVLLMSAPKARSGAAGAMQGTARLTGQTFGAIGASVIFGLLPLAQAPAAALILAAGFTAVSGMISLSRAPWGKPVAAAG